MSLPIQNAVTDSSHRPRNVILSQLPENEFAALAKYAVPVDLALGQKLSAPNEPIEYVYFLNSGLISIEALSKAGQAIEVSVIGREGLSGMPRAY